MDEELLKIFEKTGLGKISKEALPVFSKEFMKGFEYIHEINVKHRDTIREYPELVERNDIFEAWVTVTILSNFIAGFAAGKEHVRVTEEDVIQGVQSICDRYPDCYWMRFNSLMGIMPDLIRWFSKTK